ncbi:MAG TPA: DUF2334 domain-containing protein [Verrucomicrobiae bacterium]|nr:DUF2334 domain-containing protein [Verrucomicrobiae bacterium]
MRYVILRDDDTNAFTPVECLERLYRPFLDRGFPVNLATIPRVRTDTVRADGQPEEFLYGASRATQRSISLAENPRLVRYLLGNKNLRVVQHGYDHTMNEFASEDVDDLRHRIEHGREILESLGFPRANAFVAPYDQYSPGGIREIAGQFRIFSTGWFDLRRLPQKWWLPYAVKKVGRRAHWRVKGTLLLSHPGCLLSCHRSRGDMLNSIKEAVSRQQLTVLVTHWWEYFRNRQPDEEFIAVLHDTAAWLAKQPDLKVIAFDDLLTIRAPWN